MEDFNLSIEDVSYKVKKLTIFEKISTKATAKQGLTLKGESGLGKTSLIKLLAGLDLPTTGSIRYNDFEINKLSSKKRAHFRREFMGIAFQNPHIIPSLNVRQNIGLALQIHSNDKWASRNQVEEIMERFEISHRAHAYFDTLSGGEARRVALARAFVTKPKIVLLDEPLTGLDQELAARITNIIAEIKEETNALIVVATHNMKIAKINRTILDFDTLPRPVDKAQLARDAKAAKQKAKAEKAAAKKAPQKSPVNGAQTEAAKPEVNAKAKPETKSSAAPAPEKTKTDVKTSGSKPATKPSKEMAKPVSKEPSKETPKEQKKSFFSFGRKDKKPAKPAKPDAPKAKADTKSAAASADEKAASTTKSTAKSASKSSVKSAVKSSGASAAKTASKTANTTKSAAKTTARTASSKAPTKPSPKKRATAKKAPAKKGKSS